MRTPFLHLLALVIASTQAGAQSPAPPATDPVPENPAAAAAVAGENARILEKLARAQKDFEVRKKEIATNALARFTSGAMSEDAAVQFYFTCQQIVQDRVPVLDGQTKQDAKERQDRMKQEADVIADTPGRAAVIQLQLQYLVLTMEAPGYKDRGALISRLKDFAVRATGVLKTYTTPEQDTSHTKPGGKASGNNTRRDMEKQREEMQQERARRQVVQIAQQGVMGSVFAQAFNLSQYFKPMEGWPGSPLDLAGAYTGMILPYYRENKKEFLGPAWDDYMNLESTVQRCSLDDRSYARWGVGAYKNLQWSKWMDLLHNGMNRVTAADELSKLCTENPTHPNVGGWIDQLTKEMEILRNGSSPQTAPVADPPPP